MQTVPVSYVPALPRPVRIQAAPDFQCQNYGSFALLWPLNEAAAAWIATHCAMERWQWLNGAMALETVCALEILQTIQADGYTVKF